MSKPKRVKPCVCAEFGTNGLKEHTAGKKTLFALIGDSSHVIAACPNHAKYRFEDLTRKAVREWTQRLQTQQGMSRQQAQIEVLAEINRQGR